MVAISKRVKWWKKSNCTSTNDLKIFCSVGFFGVDFWNEFKDFVHLDNYAGLTIMETVIAFLYAMFLHIRHLVHLEKQRKLGIISINVLCAIFLDFLHLFHLKKDRQCGIFSHVLRNSTPRFVGPSVGPSVSPSIGPSVRPSHFTFLRFLWSLATLLLPKWWSDLCPCPPACDWGSRVSGLVFLIKLFLEFPDGAKHLANTCSWYKQLYHYTQTEKYGRRPCEPPLTSYYAHHTQFSN